MERMSKDEYYLQIAKDVAMRSTCLRRNYGAVIVNHDRIVSTGYNGAPRGEENCCDRGTCPRMENNVPHNSGTYSDCCSVHAEQNAIIHASFEDMQNGTLYLVGVNPKDGSTLTDISPCPICSRMIKNAGISRVVVPLVVDEIQAGVKRKVSEILDALIADLRDKTNKPILEEFKGAVLGQLNDSSTCDDAKEALRSTHADFARQYPTRQLILSEARVNAIIALDGHIEEETK